MIIIRSCLIFLLFSSLPGGCALLDDSAPKKAAASGLIATPPSYYSTAKAKYLGIKYKENLDRLVERIVRNSKTAPLQFANNISSVGGIGFFTHSATKTPDERYLEVVLATPETFETKGEYSEKIHRLFSRYGHDLLSILNADSDIYQDRELSGYGLNLAWRVVVADPAGNRVTMARAIIYFPKEKVRSYLRDDINQNDLLSDAVIFGEEENAPLALVSYQPQNPRPDFRPAIREDNLASAPTVSKQNQPTSAQAKEPAEKNDLKIDNGKKAAPVVKEVESKVAAKPILPTVKAEVEAAPAAPAKNNSTTLPLTETTVNSADGTGAAQPDAATEKLALGNRAEPFPANEPVVEVKPEREVTKPEPLPTPTEKATAPVVQAKPVEAPAALPATSASPTPASTSKADLPSAQLTEAGRDEVKPSASKTTIETTKNEPELKTSEDSQKAAKLTTPSKPPEAQAKAKSAEAVKPPENAGAPAAGAKLPDSPQPAREKQPAPALSVAKLENRPPTIEATPATTPVSRQTDSGAKPGETPVSPAPERKNPEAVRAAEEKLPTSAGAKVAAPRETKPAVTEVKTPVATPSAAAIEQPAVAPKPAEPIAAPQKKPPEKPTGEQLALLKNKPTEIVPEKKLLTRPIPKALEGFIIQLAFNDKEKAQHWAESMERRGFAVSVTEAGANGALRVRLGNFALRDEAERQLRTFKQDGMSGIIINLPQAFKPEARSSVP